MKLLIFLSLVTSAHSFVPVLHLSAQSTPSRTKLFAEGANGDSSAASKKKVIVLGGDGFCGWPTSLYLSDQGHEVVIVDNLSRRNIDIELGCDSLTPIRSPEVRCQAWKEVSGKEIRFVNLDVAKEYDLLVDLIKQEKPDSIVHFAEQRAAPYSMKSAKTKRYTVDNNVGGSNNLCCAVIDSEVDAHIIHLGTMGVYGYGTSGGEIPEGYIDVTLPGGRDANILHPAHPGSVYHATKCLDALLWQFYQKNDQLRITDLHQGIVWGTNTPQTALDERLINRFDYDGDYGTVLNRFLMQAAMGVPLTVYGTGGQTRAFIHISDTARCIDLAISNPPTAGDRVEIFNQVAETRRVRDIAELVASMTDVEVNFIPNPRQEAAENDLDVANRKFCNLGLDPITLDTGLFDEVTEIVKKYKSRCDPTKILPASFWNKKRAEECASIDPKSIQLKKDEAEVAKA
ncbi:UDP-sulfoquinovose synthase, plastid precursor [Phaeodactylum tricornutum CCAP 1055/1]|jgi:UDP-sulfoquinovose synthase|uniref:UDP-sulfoquinovose synthase, plastid n=3 Tax=Phaeodactylum tricornutum TaxID=2850 RepID=B5Y493_PHATC|nr:UDP-sulfoquinovose synthase, plastid precursor [Phaeodactylum tricornutum CCAP 1055/1]ACI65438.1 UDP-sulfoquinovose synthase, plastid precursor [Phaeodactylum tricornutum CCAP 1055/1]|eukprot:XP_002185968.1 UDP-sulfoquinovose synthase, plastid precursor [Phaeodactylum tricornutum CCAP 1055/1]